MGCCPVPRLTLAITAWDSSSLSDVFSTLCSGRGRFFQRREIAGFSTGDRSAIQAGFYSAAAHLLVVVLGVVVVSAVMDDLINGFPPLFKAWLVLPILATLVTLYFAYKTVMVWKDGLLASGRFDQFEVAGGRLLLEHPWMLNAFLDRFALELLRSV